MEKDGGLERDVWRVREKRREQERVGGGEREGKRERGMLGSSIRE